MCGEFVLHVRGAHGLAIACPECQSILAEGTRCPSSRSREARDRLSRAAARLRLAAQRPGVAPAASAPRDARYPPSRRPGDRGRRFGAALEESPDTAGQDAGEIPDGESRWKVAQKGDRRGACRR